MKIIIFLFFLGIVVPVFAQDLPLENSTHQLENKVIYDTLEEIEHKVSEIETQLSLNEHFVSDEEYAILVERLTELEKQNTNENEETIPNVSGIAVAGGTIALAVATFLMIRQSNSQLKQLRQQNLLTSSTNEPILKITSLRFDKNLIQCTIRNVGKGLAIHVGISTRFTPTVGTQLDIFSELEFEGAFVRPSEIINFQKDKKGMILDNRETEAFVSELLFGVGMKLFPNKDILFTKKAFTFDELKEFLTKKGITSIAVDISAVSKDVVENPADTVRMTKFFVDFKKHSTLQDAYDESIMKKEEPYFFALSQEELDWQDGELYRNSRSSRKSDL